MTVAAVLSVFIGLLIGLLGGGGSILTVPLLVYGLGVEPKTAIVTSLVVVGASSLIAVIPHAWRQAVCWKSGLYFGAAGMVGAYGGGRLAAWFDNEALMALFGLVALLTGLAMLKSPRREDPQPTGPACPPRIPVARVLFDGFFVGGLTGLVGVGGGVLVVPAMTLLLRLPMAAAVGTSVFVITLNALAGLSGYFQHASIDWQLTGVFTAGAVAGAIVGAWLSGKVRASLLRKAFGLFVMAVALFVLSQSLNRALLSETWQWLDGHRDFVLGVLTLAAVLLTYQLGRWLHRDHAPAPQATRLRPRK